MEKGVSHRPETWNLDDFLHRSVISNALRLVLILEYEWPFKRRTDQGCETGGSVKPGTQACRPGSSRIPSP